MPTYSCKNCGDRFTAREADRKRGWAKFCSKSCKAKEQTRRTGYAGPDDYRHFDHSNELREGWDEHKGSF